ncbi:hypothetical protein BDV11DRAFT_83648 [Aspergillus similis]
MERSCACLSHIPAVPDVSHAATSPDRMQTESGQAYDRRSHFQRPRRAKRRRGASIVPSPISPESPIDRRSEFNHTPTKHGYSDIWSKTFHINATVFATAHSPRTTGPSTLTRQNHQRPSKFGPGRSINDDQPLVA